MLKRIGPLAAPIVCLLAIPLAAQEESETRFRNSVFIGGGAAVPGGDLRQYMTTSALLQFGYGYRLWRYFQADISLTVVPRAAGIKLPLQSSAGTFDITDTEFMLPFGGRAVLPLAHGRLELFGGGGPAYLHYTEISPSVAEFCLYLQPCYRDVNCPFCVARNGWGAYGTAGANVALDRRRRVWIGVETRFIKGTTSGELLGSSGPFKSKDQWLNMAMNVGVGF